ncbi:MAG: hypothetical protein ING19_03810 [Azospirillum sp.]|nr:hypothetical protein [Azospirillum sp.]
MWRNTALTVRILSIDARVIFVWLFAVLGFEIWKLTLALLVTIFFKIAEFYGYRPVSAWRAIRRVMCDLCGRNRPALPRTEYRRYA